MKVLVYSGSTLIFPRDEPHRTIPPHGDSDIGIEVCRVNNLTFGDGVDRAKSGGGTAPANLNITP